MKINNVGLSLGQKSVNPFKTSRNSTTNPFQNVSFEGNTLLSADVFEAFEPKKVSKLKMISSSVAGSMNKIRSSITEPIVNFVNRIREGVSSAWDYAKNKEVTIPGMKAISETLNKEIKMPKKISDSISNMNKQITDRISCFSEGISGFGNNVSERWHSLINSVHSNNEMKKISKDTPVEELEVMLKAELDKLAMEREAA